MSEEQQSQILLILALAVLLSQCVPLKNLMGKIKSEKLQGLSRCYDPYIPPPYDAKTLHILTSFHTTTSLYLPLLISLLPFPLVLGQCGHNYLPVPCSLLQIWKKLRRSPT